MRLEAEEGVRGNSSGKGTAKCNGKGNHGGEVQVARRRSHDEHAQAAVSTRRAAIERRCMIFVAWALLPVQAGLGIMPPLRPE